MAHSEPRSATANDSSGEVALANHWLPNFCSLPILFALMVIGELVALIVVLASSDVGSPGWQRLGTATVFVQWLAVVWTVCLCKARPLLVRMRPWMSEFAAFALMVGTTAIASWLAYTIDNSLSLGLIGILSGQERFILRNSVICALVATAVLRYFYVQEQWRDRVRAEARARYEALQARIRPHFLFNSMNTIASLIRIRPAQAETAVEDLADLFRASLGSVDTPRTLGEELDLARGYLRIEELRLGERLQVVWDVASLPRDLPLPPLLLQPLVENAVYHGIQPLTDGGTVTVTGRHSGGMVEIRIANPCPAPGKRSPRGNGIAVANIRSRIAYHFDDRGALEIHQGHDTFDCVLRLPDDGTAPGGIEHAHTHRR
ncbi:sensor histidine kinase [Tahibacter amnicola]|uniref:Histidine kinase n=1 Tax=Tahibacter amnicola TaxID=2976241 RepID=A0ABY6BCT0_9GAMM|nr:histidine kinase [Tahibacter amnicola]UXI67848.1 histidine kinase [Tahibacter amnicola]